MENKVKRDTREEADHAGARLSRETTEYLAEIRLAKRNAARRERDQAMKDLGLTKVRGAMGGTYYE